MRITILLFAILFIPFACTPEETTQQVGVRTDTTKAAESVQVADTSGERPDPQHPDSLNLKTPGEWEVRLDDPDEDVVIGDDSETADIFFVNMTPGWHVTTGPAAILYHPASTAQGTYKAQTLIHMFNPQGRTEAFGLFFGGQDLQSENQSYDYFLVRNSGEYLIKKRRGDGTSVVQSWTPHDAINTYGPESESSVPNTLSVDVGTDEVRFLINGEQVAAMSRAELQTEGVVGLRINHGLNVHVEDFDVQLEQ